jgi:UDPglucose 6-dehydrogenase
VATISVWGAWHLGSVFAAGLAALGHDVWVTDLDEATVASIGAGSAPVREPGLDELIAEQLAAGRLHAVACDDRRLGSAAFHVLSADVEVGDDDVADLASVDELVARMAAVVSVPPVLVVMSQVPVGTSHRLAADLAAAAHIPPPPVVTMPENLRLGGALDVFFRPDRLIIGADDPQVAARVADLFAAVDCPKVVMGVCSAEMSKHALNAYLATSISFMSQLADLCVPVGADAWDVAKALRSDARVGPRAPILPGLGFAGGTLGRDLQYLLAACREREVPHDLFDAVLAVNRRRLASTLRRVQALLGERTGRAAPQAKVALWGLTYKPGTSTLRRSQSVELGRQLAAAGMAVVAHDPAVAPGTAELGFAVVEDPYAAAAGVDAVILMTPWPVYRELDAGRLAGVMSGSIVFDPGAFLDSSALQAAGLRHVLTGKPDAG